MNFIEILRKARIKIKSYNEKQVTFYNEKDAKKALELLQDKFNITTQKNILQIQPKKSIKEDTTSADVAVDVALPTKNTTKGLKNIIKNRIKQIIINK